MIERILLHVPAPIILACVLFCIFPVWPTASLAVAAFGLIGFKEWLSSHKQSEIKSIRDEMARLKNQIESIQISRTIGR